MYEAQNVSFRVRSKVIVDGVSLAVAPGEVVAVVGPNGAGKSSLLKLLAGECRASSGAVLLDGSDILSWSARALSRRRAVLPQLVTVAFPFIAREIVALGLPQYFPRSKAQLFVARALDEVRMTRASEQVYETLSGGERQRVQLARVLVQLWAHGSNGFLLLDEPTAGLDLPHQLATLRIARAHAEKGGGVLAVLHDLNLAVMAADRIVAMRAGQVIASGSPDEVLNDRLISSLYGVEARVSGVPRGPFLLPQMVGS